MGLSMFFGRLAAQLLLYFYLVLLVLMFHINNIIYFLPSKKNRLVSFNLWGSVRIMCSSSKTCVKCIQFFIGISIQKVEPTHSLPRIQSPFSLLRVYIQMFCITQIQHNQFHLSNSILSPFLSIFSFYVPLHSAVSIYLLQNHMFSRI